MLLLRVCFVSCIIFICVTVFECNNQISDRALERLPFRFGPQSGLLNEWMSWWVHLFLCRSFSYFCFICAFVTFHFHHWISKFSIFFSEYTILCDHAIAPYLHFIMSLFGIHAKSNTFFHSVLVSVVCHSGNTSSRRITCVIIFPLWHNVLSISTYMGNSRSTLFDFQVDLLALAI